MDFDTRHLRVIAFYVLSFAAGGVIKPFLNLYLVEVGFSGTQVGTLLGYTSFIIVLVTPLLGWFADRTQRHRLILGLIIAVKGLAAPAILLNSGWAWLTATVSIRNMTAGSQDALMTRLTIAYLKERNQSNFGGVRLWGILGFALASMLTGWLARDHSVSVLFPLSGVLGVLAGICVTGFPKQINAHPKTGQGVSTSFRWPKSLLIAFMVIFLVSIARSGYDAFANIHIKHALGADHAWIGILNALGGLTPLFAFPVVDKIFHRFGELRTLSAGILCYALAFVCLAFAPMVLWTVPAIVVYAFSDALFLVSMVMLLSRLGHPEQAATDQMIAQLTIPGIAGLFAQPLSGWIYDLYGGKWVFLLDAAILSVTLGLVIRNIIKDEARKSQSL